MVALFLVALLFVGRTSNSRSGSSQVTTSCSDVPRGDNVSVSWISFRSWLAPPGSAAVFVAIASAVRDKGGASTGQRKVELQSPQLVSGEIPTTLSVDELATKHAKAVMSSGDRLLVWGRRGTPPPTIFGNLAVVSADGSLRFLGNCIPRFDSAFAVFAASRGAELPVDVLVRILTDPNGETATRFDASAGMTLAGP